MLPTLTVLLDDGTGTFPADISRYVLAADGYSISRGRDDWQGAVTTGQLDITLNNSDGLFTPGYVGGFGLGPFGGGLYVDQQIRVKETINGVTYTRFTGYLKSLPVAWPATVSTFATVRLTATDAQARAERRPLRSALEEEILSASPITYYTLGELEGSTSAGDTSGNQSRPLTSAGSGAALTFGTGTGPADGLSAAQFFGGKYLSDGSATVVGGASTTFSACVAFNTSTIPATASTILAAGGWFIYIDTSGHLAGSAPGFPGITSADVVTDGTTHFAVVTGDGATATLYLDGASVATGSPILTGDSYGFALGGGIVISGATFTVDSTPFTGTISHAASFATCLSADQAADVGLALTGFVESGTARMTRLAGYAGVPIGTLDTSLTTVSAATGWSGSFASPEIQKVTDAEMGLTYIDGSGNLTFHNRNRVAAKTAPDLTLTSQWVTPDVNPILDDQQIINYMEVTAEGTGSTGLVRDLTSEGTSPGTGHGRYSGSQSYLVLTDQEALDRGNWIVSRFAEPTARYGTLTINLFGMTAAQAQTVIDKLDMDCWLRVVSMAEQNPGGTVADVIVQSINETATGDTWTITCNVVSRSLYTALILDDATYGALDSYPILF